MSFWAKPRAPGKSKFDLELLALDRASSRFSLSKFGLLLTKIGQERPSTAIFCETAVHQILLKRQMNYFLFPFSSPPPKMQENTCQRFCPKQLFFHGKRLRTKSCTK